MLAVSDQVIDSLDLGAAHAVEDILKLPLFLLLLFLSTRIVSRLWSKGVLHCRINLIEKIIAIIVFLHM